MPIYEFKCKKCDHVFEELVFSSSLDSENIVCPLCGDNNSEKLMSAFSASAGPYTGSGTSSCSPSGFG
jgi:putative FmdB family regulatory protein